MFLSSSIPPSAPATRTKWFVCTASGLLVAERDGAVALPSIEQVAALALPDDAAHYLGRIHDERGETDCWAAALPAEHAEASELRGRSLRALLSLLPDEDVALGGRAVQIVQWAETHRFCGRCAAPTERVPGERVLRCPRCALGAYPRVAPAVIVLVHRDDEILLARAANFPAAFHSVLAGFVEPGEALEETIVREIREEVGVDVEAPRYFGSQPWPFPHSLMIAFDARWAGGEIVADGTEIVEAAWYKADALPPIPPPVSISRRLIDAWRAGAFAERGPAVKPTER